MTERMSQKMAVLEWEKLLLYPANIPVREIPIQPSLIVPAGWGIGTALTPVGSGAYPVPAAGAVRVSPRPTSSSWRTRPSLRGSTSTNFRWRRRFRRSIISMWSPTSPRTPICGAPFLAEVANLVREADKMYASHHYNVYHFLLTRLGCGGRRRAGAWTVVGQRRGGEDFSDPGHQIADADLLAHEFTHSWNGKYRRPAGLYQPDFATPQQGALLWVYEGMTQYLGNVLAARSGLKSQPQYRDVLALSAADLDYTPGREWRPTEDTAVAASILRDVNPAWSNWRRGQDYY